MNKLTSSFALVCALVASPFAFGHANEKHGSSPSDQDKKYPLAVCVVSGDKLEDGDMGPPIDYVHKEEGKPDRLVRFCCKGCVRDFRKEPAKYLKMIDDAAADETVEVPSGHGKH